MKSTTLILGLSLALVALTPASVAGAAEKHVIGKLSKDGKRASLRTAMLKKTFPDGGPIDGFRVERRADGYQLLRLGRNAKGEKAVDAVPLRVAGKRLVIAELKWFTTCFAPECDGFCMPDGDHCDCSGESLSIDEELVLDWGGGFDVEHDSTPDASHNPGTTGGCTFGTVGGGVYYVVILP